MRPVLYHAFVVYARAGVDNHVLADSGRRVDYRPGCDESPAAQQHVGGQDRAWMDYDCELKSRRACQLGQLQPRLTIPESEDQVVDALAREHVQLLSPPKDRRAAELLSRTAGIHIVYETNYLILSPQTNCVGN